MKKTSTSPAGKKLVQARLPFKSVTPAKALATANPTAAEAELSEPTRKRKLSVVQVETSRPAKINKTSDAKENDRSCNKVVLDKDPSKEDVITVLSDSEDTDAQKKSADVVQSKDSPKKTQKLNKQTPKRKTPKSTKRKASSPIVTLSDDEIDAEKATPSYAIKLPTLKKSLGSDNKTPTRPKRSSTSVGNKLNLSIVEDGAPIEIVSPTKPKSPTKAKSPTKPKSTTPKKSPAKPQNQTEASENTNVASKAKTSPAKSHKLEAANKTTPNANVPMPTSSKKSAKQNTRVSRSKIAVLDKNIEAANQSIDEAKDVVRSDSQIIEDDSVDQVQGDKDLNDSIVIVDESSHDSRSNVLLSADKTETRNYYIFFIYNIYFWDPI